MISVSCAACGKQYKLPDTLAGKKARCKACGQTIAIPAGDLQDDPLAGLESLAQPPVVDEPVQQAPTWVDPATTTAPAPAAPRRGMSPLLLAGIGGGALVLVGVVVTAILMMGKDKPKEEPVASDSATPRLQAALPSSPAVPANTAAPSTSNRPKPAAPVKPKTPGLWTTEPDEASALIWALHADVRLPLPGQPSSEYDGDKLYLNPQGSPVVAARAKAVPPDTYAPTIVYELSKGKEIGRVEPAASSFNMVVSRDGFRLASFDMVNKDCVITVWNVATGKEAYRATLGQNDVIQSVVPVGFDADRRLIVATFNKLFVIEGADKQKSMNTAPLMGSGDFGVAISPNGRLVTRTDGQSVGLFDMASMTEVGKLPAEKMKVQGVAFSADGKQLGVFRFSREQRYQLSVYDVATGALLHQGAAESIANFADTLACGVPMGGWCFRGALFDENAQFIATFPRVVNESNLREWVGFVPMEMNWVVFRREITRGFTAYSAPVGQPVTPFVDAEPDHTITLKDDDAATRGGIGAIHWNGDQLVLTYFGSTRFYNSLSGDFRGACPSWNNDVSMSGDGKTIAIRQTQWDVLVMDVSKEKEIAKFKTKGTHPTCLSPSGNTLVCFGGGFGKPAVLETYDARTGTRGKDVEMPASVRDACFVDETHLVVGDTSNGTATMVDLASGVTKPLPGWNGPVYSLASAQGKYVIINGSVTCDGITGECVKQLTQTTRLSGVPTSPRLVATQFDRLFLFDDALHRPVRGIQFEQSPGSAMLSPDGQWIAMLDLSDKTTRGFKIWRVQSLLDGKLVFPREKKPADKSTTKPAAKN